MKALVNASIATALTVSTTGAAHAAYGPRAAGDTCADAIPITAGDTAFDSSGNTDSGVPLDGHCGAMGAVSRDIWFSYVPPVDGIVTASTCAAGSFDTSVLVYRGGSASCAALAYVACSGDAEPDGACQVYHSVAQFVAAAGVEHLIRIGGYSNGEGGAGNLNLVSEEHVNPCHCPADLDASGDIGFGDLLALLGAWGPCGVPCPQDLGGNGSVDFADLLALLSSWGPCPAEYVLSNPFELPDPPEVATDGIFAIWWAPQFDHAGDTPAMFAQLNAIRHDCLENLGMQDPPNPDACFAYNVYIHHGAADAFPDGWSNGQGTDWFGMPYLTLPNGLQTDAANLYHEGFHIFQYSAASPGFGLPDSGWYVESSAQWYMAENLPDDERAFVEAGAIVANPQLALWHGFGNEAPGDPTDWLYQVRQYGMHTLLFYLTDVAGVDPDIITGGFYSGTDSRPQEYLYAQIGGTAMRGHFADWAARNTGGLDYLTPAQVERALEEAEIYGDPANFHPYVVSTSDLEIGTAWSFESCSGGPCFEPRGWAYNVIRIANARAGEYTFLLEGDATGSEGAAAHFEGRIVITGDSGSSYTSLEMNDEVTGAGTVIAPAGTEVFLVVGSVPEHFTGNQTYGYRVNVERDPLASPVGSPVGSPPGPRQRR